MDKLIGVDDFNTRVGLNKVNALESSNSRRIPNILIIRLLLKDSPRIAALESHYDGDLFESRQR